MKTLILRTMAHSRIWEYENSHCYYDYGQLNNMILSWEPNYANFSVENFDYIFGIYTKKYFQPSRFGRYSYNGTKEENAISLMKPRTFDGTKKFVRFDNGRMFILYKFEKKLWTDVKMKPLMFSIDNALISSKINELKRLYRTKYMWPLSFSLESNTVKKIFLLHGLDLNNNCIIEK